MYSLYSIPAFLPVKAPRGIASNTMAAARKANCHERLPASKLSACCETGKGAKCQELIKSYRLSVMCRYGA